MSNAKTLITLAEANPSISDQLTAAASEIYELYEKVAFLDALAAAGVDNWSGYEDAQDILESWNE